MVEGASLSRFAASSLAAVRTQHSVRPLDRHRPPFASSVRPIAHTASAHPLGRHHSPFPSSARPLLTGAVNGRWRPSYARRGSA
eukprot:4816426-Prymnesium_polylepis.1